jgi:hypothetical protein
MASEQFSYKFVFAIALLKEAIEILRREDGARAAWRIADAGALLRDNLEANGLGEVLGVGEPTGRGALLPRLKKEPER